MAQLSENETSSPMSGVIWCPHCDGVLKWLRNEAGEQELTDEAYDHVTKGHGRTLRSRVLRRPQGYICGPDGCRTF